MKRQVSVDGACLFCVDCFMEWSMVWKFKRNGVLFIRFLA